MGYREYLEDLGYGLDATMRSKVDEWFGWYTAVNDWYSSTEFSATDRRTYQVERLSIKPARMVCQEWASLLLNERTTVACEDEATNEWLSDHLAASGFFAGGQRLVERAFALGTGAWALKVAGLDRENAYSPAARIVAQRFDARAIIPLSYDETQCTECAFLSSAVIRGKRLDVLQMHLMADGGYEIHTVYFGSDGKQVTTPPGYSDVFLTRGTTPLFSLVSPALENVYVDYSPFGVSVFDDALGVVKLVDAAVDNMHRDIWLGQKMLFLDERMLETDSSGNVVVPRAKDQQLFRKAEVDSASGTKLIEEYNPDLRVSDNRLALRTALDMLGKRTGLGVEYFSIEGASGLKTATEVVADQSDLFRSVRKHENALEPAITAIVRAVLSLARTVNGVSLPEDPGEIRVLFDDSVIEDTDAQRKRDLADIAAGLMKPYEYRVKWYGEDEKTAKAMTEGELLPPPE